MASIGTISGRTSTTSFKFAVNGQVKKGGIISKENFINISNLSLFKKNNKKTKEIKK